MTAGGPDLVLVRLDDAGRPHLVLSAEPPPAPPTAATPPTGPSVPVETRHG